MAELKFFIKENLGVISEGSKGWKKEVIIPLFIHPFI